MNTISIDLVTLTPEPGLATGKNGAQTGQSDTDASHRNARSEPMEVVVSK